MGLIKMQIDGKNIRIIKPMDTGSLYYNILKIFSISLLAVCDSNYRFLFVDIGFTVKVQIRQFLKILFY